MCDPKYPRMIHPDSHLKLNPLMLRPAEGIATEKIIISVNLLCSTLLRQSVTI